MIPALVPVKALTDSKSRLFPERGREELASLSLAMMADVIECLREVETLIGVWVVTPDAAVAARAAAEGATVLRRPDPGLNPTVEAAVREIAGPEEGALIVLADVAAADPREVAQLVAGAPGRGIALAASNDGGTSALVRTPSDVVPARFGPHSAARHRAAASEAGVPVVELDLPSLAIDVDVREDARAILDLATLGRRTRALLERWERAA